MELPALLNSTRQCSRSPSPIVQDKFERRFAAIVAEITNVKTDLYSGFQRLDNLLHDVDVATLNDQQMLTLKGDVYSGSHDGAPKQQQHCEASLPSRQSFQIEGNANTGGMDPMRKEQPLIRSWPLQRKPSDEPLEDEPLEENQVHFASEAESCKTDRFSHVSLQAKKLSESSQKPSESSLRSKTEVDLERLKCALSSSGRSSSWTNVESFSEKRKRIRSLVEDSRFEMLFGLLVCSNSILIGVEIDWAARHEANVTPLAFYIFGIIYAIMFTFELVLRMLARGIAFFYDPKEFHWHYFDIISVLSALVEVAFNTIHIFGQSGEKSSVSGTGQVRVVRILRAVRLFRFFRVSRILRFVRAMKTLLISIVGTMKSLFWSMMLLVLIIYTFAVVFTQVVSDQLNDNSNHFEANRESLQDYWGNVSCSMFTLFMSLTNGISWGLATKPLSAVSPFLVYLFLVYIIFTAFAVMNVITACFVQSSIDEARSDEEHMVQTVLSQKAAYSTICRSLFKRIDENKSGAINLKEFHSHYEEKEVQALFEALELEPEDAWSLFKLLDGDQSHSITEEEFVKGCMKCRGQAKRVDMYMFVEHYTYTVAQILGFISRAEAHLFLLSGARMDEMADDQVPQGNLQNGLGISERIQQSLAANRNQR